MANIIAAASGNFTASATWKTSDALAELDSEAGSTAIGTTTTNSSTWTTDSSIVDAVCIKLAGRVASPTGTFKVILRNTTTSADVDSVTVNVSDLPASGLGWQTFKFGTSHSLFTGNAYAIGVACSVANEVTLFRNATAGNWSRKVRTTTTQAPAAGNHIVVSNELTGAGTSNAITVTMDNTATTSFGPTVSGGPPQGMVVSGGGTVTVGTTASTAYFLKCKGIILVCGNGTFQCGSSGSRLPASSSFTLFADSAVGGDSGVVVGVGGTFNLYGATKTPWSLLTVDAALGVGTFTAANNTGWNINDTIIITPTDRTVTHYDKLVLSGTSGTGTCTTSSTSTASHSGTAPTQAEVLNVTRNIILTGASSSLTGYISFDTTSVGVLSYCEVTFYGNSTATKNGIYTATTTGSLLVQGCGIHDLTVTGSAALQCNNTNANNFIFDNNAIFNITNNTGGVWINAVLTNTNWSVTNNAMSVVTTGGRIFQFQSVLGTITGNIASASASNSGFCWQANTTNTTISTGNLILNVSSNTSHSNAQGGFLDNSQTFIGVTFGPMVAWRNNSAGITFSGTNEDLVINSSTCFGNTSFSLQLGANNRRITFNNLFSAGDSSFSTTDLANIGGGAINAIFNNCIIDSTSGIFTQHNFIFVNGGAGVVLLFNNCLINPSNALPAGIQSGGYMGNIGFGYRISSIAFQNFNGTNTDHRYYTPIYIIQSDPVIFGSAAPSERLTPFSTSLKSWSSPRQITVTSGGSHVVSVAIRASAAADAGGVAYSGNNPRLMQRANPSIGLLTDTPLATFTLATGTWGTITGTTGTATALGVQEFYVDADGTSSAWINIDDWNIV